MGLCPLPPSFNAFAPGFLDRQASCARTPGIPAPELALGLRLRRALPSAQVRQSTRDIQLEKCGRLHKTLDSTHILRDLECPSASIFDLLLDFTFSSVCELHQDRALFEASAAL